MYKLTTIAAAGALLALTASTASAQTPLTTERIISGTDAPTWAGVTGVPGDERIFVAEQNSTKIKIFKNGVENNNPYFNASFVNNVTTGGERGLLGVAFDPDYELNGYVYVNYTTLGGATQIDRFAAISPTSDRVNTNTRVPLLTIAQPFSNHNAGWMGFGPDGYLYIATGDGGSANDPQCRSQNPQNLLGKMLRIDTSVIDSTGSYGIPADNPFVNTPGFLPEIFHLGLRNPWRNSFDPLTGDLYMGDVGQGSREEVSVGVLGSAGLNYGWRVQEGELCNGFGSCSPATVPGCNDPAYTFPVQTYSHAGGNCSITGGVVYRGCAIPDLQGTYFYADYCSSRIWSFELVNGQVQNFQNRTSELDPPGLTINQITSFGRDADGEVLIIDQGGEIYRIIPAAGGSAACPSLRTDWGSLSVTFGGEQELQLDAGAANAGSLYVFAGSVSGTSPGLPLGGVTVPLNPDAYFSLTLALANVAPFENTFGVLDASGRAEAEISIPAGLLGATQAGLTLNHAAVVLDGLGAASFASNAASLTLVQ